MTFVTLGVGNNKYIDVVLQDAYDAKRKTLPILTGTGFFRTTNNTEYVDCKQYSGLTVDQLEYDYAEPEYPIKIAA